MSYIRMGQEGQYVDIPGGSNYYLYNDGEEIGGWSHEEFAALIGGVVDEIGTEGATGGRIKQHFANHFGGWDSNYSGGVQPPERGEIFCQCVDKRIDEVELTDDLHEAVEEWVDEFDALRECEYCGDEFRPYLYVEGDRYVCSSDECEEKDEAERLGVSIETLREAREFDDFVDEWDYIVSHSDELA